MTNPVPGVSQVPTADKASSSTNFSLVRGGTYPSETALSLPGY